jgi:uncharacterized membrane-anchored protein
MESKQVLKAAFNKIPQLTLLFWIMKMSATTLGETGSDLFTVPGANAHYFVPALFFTGIFVVSLILQLWSKRYVAPVYWTVILTTSLAGTAWSDYLDRTLQLGYTKGSLVLISALLLVFAFWFFTEPSMNVKQIASRKVELLYWLAILISNTLGTAAGDFLSHTKAEHGLGLSIMQGAMITGGLILLLALAYQFTNISRVFLFWIAFVLTRPFGATFGDYLIKPKEVGGLGLQNGTLLASAILLGLLVISLFVYYENHVRYHHKLSLRELTLQDETA